MRDVLLITIDSLRFDYLSYFDDDAPTSTPNLDRLARDGMAFHAAMANGPHTALSVPTLLTGEYTPAVTADTETIGECLVKGGYKTGAFSTNIQVVGPALKSLELDRGFEDFELLTGMNVDLDIALDRSVHLTSKVINRLAGADSRLYSLTGEAISALPLPSANPAVAAEQVNAEILTWLEDVDDNDSYFAWAFYLDPHEPWLPPVEYLPDDGPSRLKRYRMHRKNKKYRYFKSSLRQAEIETLQDLYAASVEYFDTQLGNLMEQIARQRGTEPYIIVTSDHGELLGEEGQFGHFPTHRGELLHVPLIVYGPKVESTDRLELVQNLDVPATIADIAGVDAPMSSRGISLFAEEQCQERDGVISILGTEPFRYVYRTSSWQLVQNEGTALYRNPDGREDLSNAHQEIVEELQSRVAELLPALRGGGEDRPNQAVDVPRDVEQQLRALGYDE